MGYALVSKLEHVTFFGARGRGKTVTPELLLDELINRRRIFKGSLTNQLNYQQSIHSLLVISLFLLLIGQTNMKDDVNVINM